jgi:hypothetical protein
MVKFSLILYLNMNDFFLIWKKNKDSNTKTIIQI